MKGRFAFIEDQYASHLTKAGVYGNGLERPAPIHEVKKDAKTDKVNTSIDKEVKVTQDGQVQVALTAADVCEALGLSGTGIGEEIGLRSPTLKLGKSGVNIEVISATIVEWNPPEVDLSIKGLIPAEGGQKEVTRQVTVQIDELIPLDKEEKRK